MLKNKHKMCTISVVASGLLSESALAHMSQATLLQHAGEHLIIGIGVAVFFAVLIQTGRRLIQ